MLWIKEVEKFDSVDDPESSCSFQGYTPFPDLELLDVRIASAMNKIIQNSHFKNKVSLEEQKALKTDRILRGRQIAHLIYDCFRALTSMNPYLIMPTDVQLLFQITIFGNSRRDGTKSFCGRNNSHLMMS